MTDPTALPPRVWDALFWMAVQVPFAGLCWASMFGVTAMPAVLCGMIAVGATLCLMGNLAPAAERRGHPKAWGWMAVLGPVGVAVVYCLPNRMGRYVPGFPIEPMGRPGCRLQPAVTRRTSPLPAEAGSPGGRVP